MTPSDWAHRLAAAIELEIAKWPGTSKVASMAVNSPEEIEVVYADGIGSDLCGIRIGSDVVRSAPQRVRLSSIEELAFDIVSTVIREPRPPEDFLPPDANGVKWLSLSQWLDEIS